MKDMNNMFNNTKKISRGDFLKLSGAGITAAAALSLLPEARAGSKTTQDLLKGKELAMVIDLQRCTGCGACAIACKNENNVQDGTAWAWYVTKTSGRFPNVRYDYTPTLCNHCKNAPCVRICPVKAMHKADGGITMHDPAKCIGCKSCISACPYIVISYNKTKTHLFWKSDKELIRGCTSSPVETVKDVKADTIPWYNPDREKNVKGSGLRHKGIVEKCTFCEHRLKQGKLPYCVERCPSKARIFGDLNDPKAKVNEILGKYAPKRLREYLGTEPKVYYVRDFNPGSYEKSRGDL